MSLDKYLKDLRFDKRMIQWNLTQKIVTEKDIQKHIQELKDLKSFAETAGPSS